MEELLFHLEMETKLSILSSNIYKNMGIKIMRHETNLEMWKQERETSQLILWKKDMEIVQQDICSVIMLMSQTLTMLKENKIENKN